MSTLGIQWFSETAIGLSGKLAFFINKSEYWLTDDMLVAAVGPVFEATGF